MRKAFTLIELVFVIVILGILATVAIPKLTSVQDDALITVEEAGIAAVRGGITGLHTKRTLNPVDSIPITITDQLNGSHDVNFTADATNAPQQNAWSPQQYPWHLSLTNVIAETTSGADQTVDAAGLFNDGTTSTNEARSPLLLVAELENVREWGTRLGDANNSIDIKGPASNVLTDTNLNLNVGSSWEYFPTTGNIIQR